MTLPARLLPWKPHAEAIGAHYRVDPLLLLALVDRETAGRNVVGDNGHGFGVAQIDRRSHAFATCEDDTGKRLALDPWLCLSYAARYLRRLLDYFNGETCAALAAYNAGQGRVRKALNALPLNATPAMRLAACNAVTTHGDYPEDVMRKRETFAG